MKKNLIQTGDRVGTHPRHKNERDRGSVHCAHVTLKQKIMLLYTANLGLVSIKYKNPY